jgi:hypothetical protein
VIVLLILVELLTITFHNVFNWQTEEVTSNYNYERLS